MARGRVTDAGPSTEAQRPIPGRAWWALAVLTLIYMLHSVDRSVMSIVIEPIKKEFHLGDGQLGILTGLAFGLTYAIAGLPLGYLIDRVDRRRLLAALLAIWSGCTALCGAVQSYGALVAARLAVGMAEAGGAPTAMSMIGDLFPPRRRSTAIGIFWASTAFGTAASFILGSLIAVHYGWRAAFLVAGLPGLAVAALLFFTVVEPRRTADASGVGAPALRETLRYVLRRPLFLHVFIGMSLNSMMLSGVLVWQASFLIRVHHLSLAKAGLLAGLAAGLFGGLGALLGGPLGDRVFRRGGMAALPLTACLTTLVSVATGLVFLLSHNLVVALGGLVLFEMIVRGYTAPGYSAIIGSVEPQMRGISVSALQIATNLVGYGLGPFLAGAVSDWVGGPDGIRWGLAALMLTGAWACIHYALAWRAGLRADAPGEGGMT
jgi:predicted MFS family arabinose efflux permease